MVNCKHIWEVTIWDKRFNGVEKEKQPFLTSYPNISAKELIGLICREGSVKLLSTGQFEGWTTEEKAGQYAASDEVVSIPSGGTANGIKYCNGKFVNSGNILGKTNDESSFKTKYFYYWLLQNLKEIAKRYRGGGIQHPDMPSILNMLIQFPSLPEQTRIVGILDTFTTFIENLKQQIAERRKQYEYYRDQLLDLKGKEGVEMKTLGDVGEICMCKRIMKDQTSDKGEIPFFKIGTFGGKADAYIARNLFEEYKNKFSYPKKGDILISAAGTIGRSVVFDGEDAYFQDSNIVWIANDETVVSNRYLYYFYQIAAWKTDGGTIKRLYNYNLKNTEIPVPSLSEQSRIVSILDTFEASIANLEAQLELREKQYEYYRNKLLTFE